MKYIKTLNVFISESKTDRNGNIIGDGSHHVKYYIIDIDEYPSISYTIEKSKTTESVYVRYFNSLNNKNITVRFSDHVNNAVAFGDQLDGYFSSRDEILYHLGLKKRKFIPKTYKYISSYQVKRSAVNQYEMIDLTWPELYDLPVGTDISKYTGKIGKNSNRVISGTTVENRIETTRNIFGDSVQVGEYVYESL